MVWLSYELRVVSVIQTIKVLMILSKRAKESTFGKLTLTDNFSQFITFSILIFDAFVLKIEPVKVALLFFSCFKQLYSKHKQKPKMKEKNRKVFNRKVHFGIEFILVYSSFSVVPHQSGHNNKGLLLH